MNIINVQFFWLKVTKIIVIISCITKNLDALYTFNIEKHAHSL